MDLGLNNARVVVTGGASNIGRGIVHQFAAEGSRIVISDIDEPQAEKVRAEALERGAAAVELAIADLTTPDGAAEAIGRAVTAWGGIDVLVNNAGWSVPGFIATDTDRDKWQRTMEVNFFSAVSATQAALGPMKDAGGALRELDDLSAGTRDCFMLAARLTLAGAARGAASTSLRTAAFTWASLSFNASSFCLIAFICGALST